MKPLTISSTAIRQDTEGRYCLNDLHRAGMARGTATKHHRPGEFLRRKETQELIAAAAKRCADSRIDPVAIIKGGDAAVQGTFVSRPLVYAYAMWINADFHLDVIEAFDTIQTASLGLWQQMQALIAREVESKVRASFGSHLMLERKREIPSFRHERLSLESQIQPTLLPH
ncbi:KilA-N domain-containing protein [Polaromonas sp. OV174]|uniref:KilA-N domain-containing protein n=1 Tax=Polaromonas sp. OV174 TaxID=1855300 RepID=UPI0008EBC644|nr:KilA-N domain-containing protein [Polaromonas sp. OV174]SFB74132.1 KilA-N domain-containing protein [Polaromonas sp. OV174]